MRAPLLIFLLLLPAAPLEAQWRLSLSAGSAATSGHSRDTLDDEQPAILPDHPVDWTLALVRQHRAWRLGVDGHRVTSDLAIRGRSTTLVTRTALSAWGVGAELARRIASPMAGPQFWVAAGGVYERWSFDIAGGEARWRAAARGALQLDIPLVRHWSGMIRGEASLGCSLFRREELPEGYQRRAARRLGLQLGVTLADNRR